MRQFSEILVSPPLVEILRVEERVEEQAGRAARKRQAQGRNRPFTRALAMASR